MCPVTNEQVLPEDIVCDVLSLMYSCGLYTYSGQFSFEVGLPAKSGVSGLLMMVVPNVAGLCFFSPRLDANGNSVRGLESARQFVELVPCHLFRTLLAQHKHRAPRAATRSVSFCFGGDTPALPALSVDSDDGLEVGSVP